VTAPKPVCAPDEILLDPASVIVGERIGFFWPDKAAALGALMLRDGQSDAIKVARVRVKDGGADQYRLIAGLHRLEGAKAAGLEAIRAAVTLTANANELLLIEASENIHRRDFGPIERALFIRAIAFAAEQRATAKRDGASPQELAVRARWEKAKASAATRADELAEAEADHTQCQLGTAYGWTEELADSLGMSRAALFRSLKIHRQLVAPFDRDLWEALARSALGQKQAAMLDLASIADMGARRRVMQVIADNVEGDVKSIADAMVLAGVRPAPERNPADGQTKFVNNAQANLQRLTSGSWRSFAPSLVEVIKPSALIAVRDALTARIRSLSPDELGESGGGADV
jgi:ParB family transcriptional regulator, chromosome partitioning protein